MHQNGTTYELAVDISVKSMAFCAHPQSRILQRHILGVHSVEMDLITYTIY